MLILDDVAPVVEMYDLHPGNVIAAGRNLTFFMTIPAEKYSLNVTMFYQGDGKTYQLVETGNDVKGNYIHIFQTRQMSFLIHMYKKKDYWKVSEPLATKIYELIH